ncbi:MAG: RecX family transcriptional regulator [Bacteroidetes bacterium]|nr:RecX family transcriptional regulator [Bacteroidota bacterium]
MTITSIQRQKKNRHRVSVYLDGEFAFGINDEAVYRFGLHKGMVLEDDRRAEIERYDNLVQSKLVAERLLGVRMRSERELRQRLLQKGFPPEAVDETIAVFLRVNLLDDAEFARLWVRDRLRLRPRSSSFLRRELRSKGVKDDIITQVLADAFEHKEDIDVARELAASYCRKHPSLEADVLKRRLVGFLQRKGYSASVVYDVVGEERVGG